MIARPDENVTNLHIVSAEILGCCCLCSTFGWVCAWNVPVCTSTGMYQVQYLLEDQALPIAVTAIVCTGEHKKDKRSFGYFHDSLDSIIK